MKRTISAVFAILLLFHPISAAVQKPQDSKKKQKAIRKDVQNFDGGILFETDGGLSELTCFKLVGRVTAGHFFDDFKRMDDEQGTEYRSGQELVTEFPEELHVAFVLFDIPCPNRMQHPGPRMYLTEEMMKSLLFSFYWKRGVEMRHIEKFKREAATAALVEPYNTESKEELPKRYRWFLEYTIPSAGVPLTDRLVLIIRTPAGRRSARVAARL